MLFDSHTHLNNEDFTDAQRRELAKEIESSEVSYVVDIGFNLESSLIASKHAEQYSWCYATAGYHPHDAKDMDDMSFKMIKALASKPKVVAIGETGLDFYRNLSPKDVQRDVFRKQIRLAIELKKPLVIHSREADGEVLSILKEEQAFANVRVLLHCYSGRRELAEQFIKLGAMISIAGPVTYSNARKLVEVVEKIPIESLLIETDAPYLTPEPLRGQRNKSPNVKYTAMKVAEIKGMSYEDVAKITCENAKRFYGIV